MGISPAARGALEWVCSDFDALLDQVQPAELTQPTLGTRWTNRELLFHMAFGQRITRVFIPLMGGFSRLPAGASRAYARLLSTATAPYEWINYAGSAAAGRRLPLETVRAWMHHDTRAILRWASTATDADLGRGMAVPITWDPYFTRWMSRRDMLARAPMHYRHHRAQLSLHP